MSVPGMFPFAHNTWPCFRTPFLASLFFSRSKCGCRHTHAYNTLRRRLHPSKTRDLYALALVPVPHPSECAYGGEAWSFETRNLMIFPSSPGSPRRARRRTRKRRPLLSHPHRDHLPLLLPPPLPPPPRPPLPLLLLLQLLLQAPRATTAAPSSRVGCSGPRPPSTPPPHLHPRGQRTWCPPPPKLRQEVQRALTPVLLLGEARAVMRSRLGPGG
jgi:hypothetical protein